MKQKKTTNLIKATVIADSLHEGSQKRLTTIILTLPRIVLSELNTHRVFSRNSGSSRAIPNKRMRKSVKENLFIPLAFQKHHTGMQGTEYHEIGSFRDKLLRFAWKCASKAALFTSGILYSLGATKQLANRILEPFMWHTVIISSTEWENFFRQRCPQYGPKASTYSSWEEYIRSFINPSQKNDVMDYSLTRKLAVNKGAAEIHISLAAEAIYLALKASRPKVLSVGEYHIPFRDEIEEVLRVTKEIPEVEARTELIVKCSTALCAMVSFTEVGGKSLFEKIDLVANPKLHDRLIEDDHMTPTEHCAKVVRKLGPWEYSNFKGNWLQYRKIVEKRNII